MNSTGNYFNMMVKYLWTSLTNLSNVVGLTLYFKSCFWFYVLLAFYVQCRVKAEMLNKEWRNFVRKIGQNLTGTYE